jgi:glucosamine--fructose-6-phosphate aminotransferase (isomerizing)
MCGIFGVTNDPTAAKTILEGLKRLEYRGYDSWGIAIKNNHRFQVDKHIGKISVSKTALGSSSFGVGHTRWATHGGVTSANAHPHLDCHQKIVVVHNGIIDNWQLLKANLKTHKFRSQTDSEIIAHLVEDKLERESDFFTAVTNILPKIEGFNAFLLAHADFPYLIAYKTGSPLVIGLHKGNNMIASDVSSLLPYTNKVIFLEDGQVAKIEQDKVAIFKLNKLVPVSPKTTIIQWTAEQADKGSFPHYMLKEISEQPEILIRLSQSKKKETKQLAGLINKASDVFAVACGSAAHAAQIGEYFFAKIAKKQLNPAIGSEFSYYAKFLTINSLCIALSQSGETIDTLQSIQTAKAQKSKTSALVNVRGSSLDRLCDQSIYLDVGPEKAVASTKAFLAKLVLLYMTAYELTGNPQEATKNLSGSAKAISKLLTTRYTKKLKLLAGKLKNVQDIFVLGRGTAYPAALEIALKIKEISYIHAEGFAAGELKHGVIALIKKKTPTIVLAPLDETYQDIISGATEVKARGGLIIGISPENNPIFDIHLPVDDVGNASVLPIIVLGQLLAYYLALAKKLDPDMPRNLAKSVTVK